MSISPLTISWTLVTRFSSILLVPQSSLRNQHQLNSWMYASGWRRLEGHEGWTAGKHLDGHHLSTPLEAPPVREGLETPPVRGDV